MEAERVRDGRADLMVREEVSGVRSEGRAAVLRRLSNGFIVVVGVGWWWVERE